MTINVKYIPSLYIGVFAIKKRPYELTGLWDWEEVDEMA